MPLLIKEAPMSPQGAMDIPQMPPPTLAYMLEFSKKILIKKFCSSLANFS